MNPSHAQSHHDYGSFYGWGQLGGDLAAAAISAALVAPMVTMIDGFVT
jgi:hypothetical protein